MSLEMIKQAKEGKTRENIQEREIAVLEREILEGRKRDEEVASSSISSQSGRRAAMRVAPQRGERTTPASYGCGTSISGGTPASYGIQ